MKFRLFFLYVIAFGAIIWPNTVEAQTSLTPSILFSPEDISSTDDQIFTTDLVLDTAGQPVGGVGAKITFDPKYVIVENIETHAVFPDFPSKTFDNNQGRAVISGIVRSKNELYTGSDKFATITWRTKAVGNTNIELIYVPNSTKDSNIAVLQGSGDILEKVNDVHVTISGGPSRDSNTSSTQPQLEIPSTVSPPAPSLVQKLFPPFALLWAMGMFLSQLYLLWRIHRLEKVIKGRLHENPSISV